MKLFFIFILYLSMTFGIEYKLLLNSYHNPNRLVFRLNGSSFECSLLGVVIPFYSNENKCINDKFRKMSNLSIGFFQNNLNLEQLYSVSFENGFCIVKYRNFNLSEEIIKSGYGVVNTKSIFNNELLDKLLYLQNIAIENRAGLWNSFYDEMECFRDSY